MTELHAVGASEPTKVELLVALERTGLTRNGASRQMGMSPTTLSQWLGGKYPGDNAAVEAKVARWLHTQRESERHGLDAAGLDTHRTLGVTEEVAATLAHAQAVGDVVLVHGLSGAGKSWGAAHYCATHSSAYYLEMTCAVRTLSGMLSRVSAAVGAPAVHRSALEAETAVIEQLRDRHALLVVDEAHHLTARLLDELRCIRDHARCGLALIGNDAIRMTLARCPQIVGRIASRLEKRVPSEADVATLVAGVLGRAPKKAELAAAVAAARRPGGLHALRRLLERAWLASRVEGRDTIVADDLEAAAEAGPVAEAAAA